MVSLLPLGSAADGAGLGSLAGGDRPGVAQSFTVGGAALGAGLGEGAGGVLPGVLALCSLAAADGLQLEGVDRGVGFLEAVGGKATVILQILIVGAVICGADITQVDTVLALDHFPQTAVGESAGKREGVSGCAGGQILALGHKAVVAVFVGGHGPLGGLSLGAAGKLTAGSGRGNIKILGRVVDHNGTAGGLFRAADGACAVYIAVAGGRDTLLIAAAALAAGEGLLACSGTGSRNSRTRHIIVLAVDSILRLSGGSGHGVGDIFVEEKECILGVVDEDIAGAGDGLNRVVAAQLPGVNGIVLHPLQKNFLAFDDAVGTPHSLGVAPTDIDIEHDTGHIAAHIILVAGLGVGVIVAAGFAVSLVAAASVL